MPMSYHLRLEHPNGSCTDHRVGGESIEDARRTLQAAGELTIERWDWRGGVAFVNGARPAEERVR